MKNKIILIIFKEKILKSQHESDKNKKSFFIKQKYS